MSLLKAFWGDQKGCLACGRVGDFGSSLGVILDVWYVPRHLSSCSFAECQLQEMSCLSYSIAGTNVTPSFDCTFVVVLVPIDSCRYSSLTYRYSIFTFNSNTRWTRKKTIISINSDIDNIPLPISNFYESFNYNSQNILKLRLENYFQKGFSSNSPNFKPTTTD